MSTDLLSNLVTADQSSISRVIVSWLINTDLFARDEWRRHLLDGFTPTFAYEIRQSDIPRIALANIVDAAWSYHDSEGRVGVILLLDNAIALVPNSDTAEQLTQVRKELLDKLKQPGFLNQPVTPSAGDQYIVPTCKLNLALLSEVEPSKEDRGYITTVLSTYHIYGEPGNYIESKLMPPAEYVAGDLVRRSAVSGSGSTVKLWQLCNVNQALLDARRLLVLGRPGVGKTSLIQYLTWLYANLQGMQLKNGAPPPDALLLPIIVSLSGWHDPPDKQRTLLQYIKDFLTVPSDPDTYPSGRRLVNNLDRYLEDLDQQRRLFFFLDDYNRLSRQNPADYERRWAEIVNFANDYDQAAVVVVCRSLDYDGHLSQCQPRFTVLEISPWSEDQVSAFLMRHAPDLLPALSDPKLRTDLLDLGQIPQVLMLLVDAVRAKKLDLGALAGDRQAVLGVFVDRLFDYAERTGSEAPPPREQVRGMLERVAVGLVHDHKKGCYIDWPTLLGYVGPDAGAPDLLRRLLRMADEATILSCVAGPGLYGFEDELIENYFALCGAETTGEDLFTPGLASTDHVDILETVRLMDQGGKLVGYAASNR